MSKFIKINFQFFCMCLALQGCLGTIVGTTVDVAIEVVKVSV